MKKISLIALILLSAIIGNAQGGYLEYKITSDSNSISGTMKMYTQDGNSRTEMNMVIPQMPAGGINVTTISKKESPLKVYMLNTEDKTYSEMDMSRMGKQSEKEDFEVTVVGKEKVNGYNATHVILKMKSMPSHGQDMWLSTEVPNYQKFKNINSKYTNEKLFKTLTEKGVEGFMVRMKMNEHNMSFQMDLVKAEVKANPASIFSLDGYTKSESSMPGGAGMQEMMKKMQNMTPEERQKMVDEMKEKYGQPK